MKQDYYGISQERFEVLQKRYLKFTHELDVPNIEPVKVFDPLSKKNLDELHLIREASKVLQRKKDEDMKKAAQAAEEAAAAAKEEEKKKSAEKKSETTENGKEN